MVSISNPFSRKKDEFQEARMAITGSVAAADSQRPTSEIEMMQQLGINIHMIESEKLMDDLRKLAERHFRSVVKDDDGAVVYDKAGKPVFEERVYYHPVFMTLKVYMDKLFSTQILDRWDAALATTRIEYEFNNLKMQLSPEEYSQWSSLIEALKSLAIQITDSCIDGRKVKYLKVTPRAYDISFHQEQKPTPGGYSQ